MDFWARLKLRISNQNTTQEWLAGRIGVPLSTFRKWMHRKTYPNIKAGIEIAKLLGTSAEYLVTGIQPHGLNEAEHQLISDYRQLNLDDRENITLIINAWLKKEIAEGHRRVWKTQNGEMHAPYRKAAQAVVNVSCNDAKKPGVVASLKRLRLLVREKM